MSTNGEPAELQPPDGGGGGGDAVTCPTVEVTDKFDLDAVTVSCDIDNTSVNPGERVTVSVIGTNPNSSPAQVDISLQVDGQIRDSTTASIPAGSSDREIASLAWTPQNTGSVQPELLVSNIQPASGLVGAMSRVATSPIQPLLDPDNRATLLAAGAGTATGIGAAVLGGR